MSIGRNDRCPCGSGAKYKKCHGAPDLRSEVSPEVTRAAALKAADVALGERLMRFARTRYGPDWLNDVLESEGLLDDGTLAADDLPLVVPWLQHRRVNGDGVTLADEWSRQAPHRASPDERLLLNAYRDAWLSVWEVAEVRPGTGSLLTDLLTREQRFVHDVSSSATLRRFDSMLASILTCDGISFFGGAHAQPLPPRFAALVVQEARRMCRVRTRPVALEKLRDPDVQLDLLGLWCFVLEDMLDQPPPFVQNTDGDTFAPTRDDFALVGPRDVVAHRLESLPGVRQAEAEGDDSVFVVTREGNAIHRSWDNTVIGRIVLSETRLTVETNSTRRADSLRSLLEKELEGLVRFRLRSEENSAHFMAEELLTFGTRGERPEEPLPPEALAELRRFREQHIRDWIDTAIPALRGLTPREASRLPSARPELAILLKELEQNEEGLPEQQRIDLQWLREALDLR